MPDTPTGEILVHLEYIREAVDGTNTRLDKLNGQTRHHAERIAAIEAVLAERGQRPPDPPAKRYKVVGIGAAVTGVVTLLKLLFSGSGK